MTTKKEFFAYINQHFNFGYLKAVKRYLLSQWYEIWKTAKFGDTFDETILDTIIKAALELAQAILKSSTFKAFTEFLSSKVEDHSFINWVRTAIKDNLTDWKDRIMGKNSLSKCSNAAINSQTLLLGLN